MSNFFIWKLANKPWQKRLQYIVVLNPGVRAILINQLQVLQPENRSLSPNHTYKHTNKHSYLYVLLRLRLPDDIVLRKALSFVKSLSPSSFISPLRHLCFISGEIKNHRRLGSSHAVVLSSQNWIILRRFEFFTITDLEISLFQTLGGGICMALTLKLGLASGGKSLRKSAGFLALRRSSSSTMRSTSFLTASLA